MATIKLGSSVAPVPYPCMPKAYFGKKWKVCGTAKAKDGSELFDIECFIKGERYWMLLPRKALVLV